jgi:hypothetical protein
MYRFLEVMEEVRLVRRQVDVFPARLHGSRCPNVGPRVCHGHRGCRRGDAVVKELRKEARHLACHRQQPALVPGVGPVVLAGPDAAVSAHGREKHHHGHAQPRANPGHACSANTSACRACIHYKQARGGVLTVGEVRLGQNPIQATPERVSGDVDRVPPAATAIAKPRSGGGGI